ncbi:MAG TPA: protease complex subunit PrcB family protein [Nitrospiria bacterium]|jgi:hypothetical protein
MLKKKSYILLFFLILFGPIGTTLDAKEKEFEFETIDQGIDSKITTYRRGVIQNSIEWKALWKEHQHSELSLPVVDFQKEGVVVVFLGIKGSAGYSVEIYKVEEHGRELKIYFEELKPDPNCMVAQVITSPFHMVRISASEKESVFLGREKIQDCRGN